MAQQTKTTTDHDTIKQWVEVRKGRPCVVTKNNRETELLRIDFPDYEEENLRPITWKKWFEIFERNNLALVYQEKTKEGKTSSFNKIVDRETAPHPE